MMKFFSVSLTSAIVLSLTATLYADTQKQQNAGELKSPASQHQNNEQDSSPGAAQKSAATDRGEAGTVFSASNNRGNQPESRTTQQQPLKELGDIPSTPSSAKDDGGSTPAPQSDGRNGKEAEDRGGCPAAQSCDSTASAFVLFSVASLLLFILSAASLALIIIFYLKWQKDKNGRKAETENLKVEIADRFKEDFFTPLRSEIKSSKSSKPSTANTPSNGVQNTLSDMDKRITGIVERLSESTGTMNRSLLELRSSASSFEKSVKNGQEELETLISNARNAELLRDLGKVREILREAANDIGDRIQLKQDLEAARSEIQSIKADLAQVDTLKGKVGSLQEGTASLQQEKEKLTGDLRLAEEKRSNLETQLAELRESTGEQRNKLERYEAIDQQAIPDFITGSSELAGFLKEFRTDLFNGKDEVFRAAFRFGSGLAGLSYAIGADSSFDTETWIQLKIFGKSLNSYLRATGKSEADIAGTMSLFGMVLSKAAPTANGANAPAFTLILPKLGQSINTRNTSHVNEGTVAEKILNWGIVDARGNCQVKAEVA